MSRIIRWAIPNFGHMPVEVWCERADTGPYASEQMYECFRTSDDSHVFGTTMEYLFSSEREALLKAEAGQAARAQLELLKWDQIRERIVEVT